MNTSQSYKSHTRILFNQVFFISFTKHFVKAWYLCNHSTSSNFYGQAQALGVELGTRIACWFFFGNFFDIGHDIFFSEIVSKNGSRISKICFEMFPVYAKKKNKKHDTCLRKKLAGKISPNFWRWCNKQRKMTF